MSNSTPNQSQDANEILMQLRYMQSLYGQQYENLENNIATYTMTNTSLQRNIELLEKSKSMENSHIMISGEGGAYVPAKIEKVNSVLTYVGGGYLIETTVDQSLEFLRANSKKGEEILNKILAEKKKVEKELVDIDLKLNALQYQMQSQGQV